jgi:hypothetical protein
MIQRIFYKMLLLIPAVSKAIYLLESLIYYLEDDITGNTCTLCETNIQYSACNCPANDVIDIVGKWLG